MLGSPAGPGGPPQRGLWPLVPGSANSATTYTSDAFGKCGVYSLFPGGPSLGNAFYSHARTIGQFATTGHIQQPPTNTFYHKDSIYSTSSYTFGAPTPPPGSPYSPVSLNQFDLLSKGFSPIIAQQPDYLLSAQKKLQIPENKRCDEKCCKNQTSSSPLKNKTNETLMTGCSRTNPVAWNTVSVKKEPDNPAEIAPLVKLEITSPKNSNTTTQCVSNTDLNNCGVGNISVGFAVARQKLQPDIIGSPALPPVGLLTTVNAAAASTVSAQIKDNAGETTISTGSDISNLQGTIGGGTILHCSDDRGGALAGWTTMGGAHNPAAVNTPTVWQYPAPVPMEPMLPLPVPMPPVGFQLARDPTTGGLLLFPTTEIETLQQAVVWPTYHQHPPVLLPPLPPLPLQLLTSASSDFISSTATLHQQTQSHSTRLLTVATDSKRKLPTLIKIETDAANLDHQSKALQTINPSTVFTSDQNVAPIVTTHVIYQHPQSLIISQPPINTETLCRSQATSPVTCLTPPPDVSPPALPETTNTTTTTVQDASNQTDVDDEAHLKVNINNNNNNNNVDANENLMQVKYTTSMSCSNNNNVINSSDNNNQVPDDHVDVDNDTESKIDDNVCGGEVDSNSNIVSVKDIEKPDISGLELLSNSIIEYANSEKDNPTNPIKDPVDVANVINNNNNNNNNIKESLHLDGLDLLCALAEQRILEENVEKSKQNKRINESPDSQYHHKKKTKFIDSDKSTIYNNQSTKNEWPCMNEAELDMRIKLADLQRQYREKQKELKKLKPSKRHSQENDSITTPSTPIKSKSTKDPIIKPPTLCCIENKTMQLQIKATDDQHEQIDNNNEPTFLSLSKRSSSSKKRKVGRPKKLQSSPGYHVTTETIVAKKPKSNFVGYLLAAKEKFQLQRKLSSKSPPKYLDDASAPVKQKKINNFHEIKLKIKPKLRAEPVAKVTTNDIEIDQKLGDDVDTRCTLTAEHLEVDKLRVLTAMGGLFYAGILNAVEPPDVYSITLDGERGNKPHIMSREEILRDAFLELSPKKTEELSPGTRVCAYWSQQYRCLYPGTVAEPGTPDPLLDDKFVAVEFDDGDSGRIAIDDIRLLPSNYPIIEYDPNPLLSLSKRKRRISSSVSNKESESARSVLPTSPESIEFELNKENKDVNSEAVKERKRLKKKKRDKLKQKLLYDDRKKKKKHRCNNGEYCKHKKHHKRHHKHKKHHHHHHGKPAISDTNYIVEIRDDNIEPPQNPEDEVTLDDITEITKDKEIKKIRDRQESCESRSKMSAFLPARQLWGWAGKGYRRPRAKGRSRKQFYKSIQRGKEIITVGDAAVFLSTGRPDRPYIGKIEAMWELCGTMAVKVKWYYHPEETVGCPLNLQYPGALFESPHLDENDVQTISHKCEVLPLSQYIDRLGNDPQRYASIYDNNDIYYLAGHYDPTTTKLKIESDIPFKEIADSSNK